MSEDASRPHNLALTVAFGERLAVYHGGQAMTIGFARDGNKQVRLRVVAPASFRVVRSRAVEQHAPEESPPCPTLPRHAGSRLTKRVASGARAARRRGA
jgi:hypothetical protein